ncbi:protein transport protein SEC16B homolog isoform X2 [Diospyros lotus]|uniref:protein transport protein SEC16B homolog isoform X2 n=1 Tax=Diospyros lotus TaxID=55363 RepID=UPI00224D63BB|nr:protein transport protein SEC16B homolog isoform X2 [Diospyros lotus]
MASTPPFQVEDQTDEDFFDKLVDDDDEFKASASSSGHNFADGNDSDEVKAFANLSTGEADGRSEGVGGEGQNETNKGEGTLHKVNPVSVDGHTDESSSVVSSNSCPVDGHFEESNSLVSSNSFAFDNVIEPNGMATETKDTPDPTIDKVNESVGSGVKEVQWTAFNTDSGHNDSNGFGSYSDFFSELGDGAIHQTGKVDDSISMQPKIGSDSAELTTANVDNKHNYMEYQENQSFAATMGQNDGQDLNNTLYWENLYPGWKYDTSTGQWYQIDGFGTAGNVQGTFNSTTAGDSAVSDGNSQVSYLQQTAQSSEGTISESGTMGSVTNLNQLSHESRVTGSSTYWNQVPQCSSVTEGVSSWSQVSQQNEYPAHMVFDPQYPGWYYDTISQEWRSLDTYTSLAQSAIEAHNQLSQNSFASMGACSQSDDKKSFNDYGLVEHYGSHDFGAQSPDYNWAGSVSNYNQQPLNMLQAESVAKNEAPTDFSGNQQLETDHGSNFSTSTLVNQQKSYVSRGIAPAYETATQPHNEFASDSHGFVSSANFTQHIGQAIMQQNEQMHVSSNYYGNQNSANFSQQQFQSSPKLTSTAGRSSAGRPPHALVTFGFGGKLIVVKDHSSLSTSSYGSQGHVGGSISVLNLMELVTQKFEASSTGVGNCDYFDTLCRQSFPGPLVGGNVGSKELNKWIDERIVNCEFPAVDYRKGEVLRLLLSLLKIACQYYGKLRSPIGTDTALKESDVPESAVAKLFASVKRDSAQFSDYGALAHCLQKLPSEGQMQATAAEVQSLLVSGRKKEALHRASEGQLWGPALVLAAQLGDQFYVDTTKKMALHQLVAGSPLRTLCLLIAGQPAEVFSSEASDSSFPGALNMSAQPAQDGSNFMLADWEENLAVITANRTKDDELVLIHLGDCLWKDRSEIVAAHICYLVAEANFEPYSDTARLCLIGADHWKFPRTYVTPEAIQRTELFEYSKVLGNPQFTLLPFQPYKLIYAHMLAEVGKVTESLKYCQAVFKSLKNGRTPEVDTLRQLVSSLEERIRTHQQGGYSTNLAPGKLVGKLLNLFDSTAHRVVGGLPPPVPSASQGSVQANALHHEPMGPRVSASQSTMAMSSLMPSASVEPISELRVDGNRMTIHNRSISEPDIGRTPRQDQVDSSKEATSSNAQGKASASAGASRFGRFNFGSQLLQKTMGLVSKPWQDRQAKLGEKNKFYYDEKLKRWVEEGAEPPAEEAALPPPPTSAALQNGTSDYNLRGALKSENSPSSGSPEFTSPSPPEQSSGIPPIPPVQNQFSARGRAGVRSRYVDTFNKGGGNPTNLFQSSLVPPVKPAASGANPKFFVPTPVSSSQQSSDSMASSTPEPAAFNQNLSNLSNSSDSPASLSSMSTLSRYPSMDNISNKETKANPSAPLPAHSRRTASWSGSFNVDNISPQQTEAKPLGEVMGIPPSLFVPSEPSFPPLANSGGGSGSGEDLHEVEL